MKKIISFVLATVMLLGMFSIGTFAEAPLTLDMRAVEGASVRIGEVAGIRFQTMINKAELDATITALCNNYTSRIAELEKVTNELKGKDADQTQKIAEIEVEHCPGFAGGSYISHEFVFEDLPINSFDNESFVIRYGARGNSSDDWMNKVLKVKIILHK